MQLDVCFTSVVDQRLVLSKRSGLSKTECCQVALSVPDDNLDWELIVLDASRATYLGPSKFKLRRGDRILRVEEVSERGGMVVAHPFGPQ